MKGNLYNLFIFYVCCVLPCNLFSQDAKEIPGLKKIAYTTRNYSTDTDSLLSKSFTVKEFNKNGQLTYRLDLLNNDTIYLEKNSFNDKGKPLNKYVKETRRNFFSDLTWENVAKSVRYTIDTHEYDEKGNEIRSSGELKEFINDTLDEKRTQQYVYVTQYKYAANDSILNIITKRIDKKRNIYYEVNKYGPFGKTYSKICDDENYADTVLHKWTYDKTGRKTSLTTLKYSKPKKEQTTENYFYDSANSLIKIESANSKEPGEKKIVYINNNKTDSTVQYKKLARVSYTIESMAVADTLPKLSFFDDFRDNYFYRKLLVDKQNRVIMAYLDFDGFPRLGFFEYKDKSIYPVKIERFSKNLYDIEKSRKYPEYVMEYYYEFH